MGRRVHGWLLAFGVILILAGIAVLIRLDSAPAAPASADRARLVEAIVDLQGCFCHDATTAAPLLAYHADEAAIVDVRLVPHNDTVQRVAVETRLISTGQRLLALPDTPRLPDQQAEAVIGGFLQIVDQTRLAGVTGETLSALRQLEFWLGLLENRAQTARWSRAGTAPPPPDESAWQAVPLVSRDYAAAFALVSAAPDVTRLCTCLGDDHRAVVRAEDVRHVQRRGPPAGVPYLLV